ncbi:hypothetical protein GPALN_004867 [Globodera pallida]|nr:hypothetical protein GPALN_004867 [Globodera pallida]
MENNHIINVALSGRTPIGRDSAQQNQQHEEELDHLQRLVGASAGAAGNPLLLPMCQFDGFPRPEELPLGLHEAS